MTWKIRCMYVLHNDCGILFTLLPFQGVLLILLIYPGRCPGLGADAPSGRVACNCRHSIMGADAPSGRIVYIAYTLYHLGCIVRYLLGIHPPLHLFSPISPLACATSSSCNILLRGRTQGNDVGGSLLYLLKPAHHPCL